MQNSFLIHFRQQHVSSAKKHVVQPARAVFKYSFFRAKLDSKKTDDSRVVTRIEARRSDGNGSLFMIHTHTRAEPDGHGNSGLAASLALA